VRVLSSSVFFDLDINCTAFSMLANGSSFVPFPLSLPLGATNISCAGNKGEAKSKAVNKKNFDFVITLKIIFILF
jgi:hypothetical protein